MQRSPRLEGKVLLNRMNARHLTCVGLALVTCYGLLVILWAFWFVVFIDVMRDAPSWMLALGMGVAILSGFVLYFLVISWEVSRVLKRPASQAKGMVAFCCALPLVTLAFAVWYVFKDWRVLGST